MSVPKFTPGPWRHVLRSNQLGPRHLFVADQSHKRCYFKTDKPTEQDIADARLIAAAPELYEALSKAVAFAVPDQCSQWIGEATRALAKARGEAA